MIFRKIILYLKSIAIRNINEIDLPRSLFVNIPTKVDSLIRLAIIHINILIRLPGKYLQLKFKLDGKIRIWIIFKQSLEKGKIHTVGSYFIFPFGRIESKTNSTRVGLARKKKLDMLY